MWQLRDISMLSHFHGSSGGLHLSMNLTSWPTSPDQPGVRRGLFPYPGGGGNLMANSIMEDLVKPEKWMGVNTFHITCGKNCPFQVPVCKLWLTLEKLFGQIFSWEAGFSASTGWKKSNEFLKQSIQSCATAPHEQDVAECCHSTTWSVQEGWAAKTPATHIFGHLLVDTKSSLDLICSCYRELNETQGLQTIRKKKH